MPWSGTGTYSLPPAYSPEVNGTAIDAARYNGLTTDVAAGITAALAKNGENVPTANLPMGGFKHTGAGDGNSSGQYMTWGNATGKLGNLDITANTLPPNGFYLPSANTLGFSTNTTQRGTVGSGGNWQVNAPSSGIALNVGSASPTFGFIPVISASGAASSAYIGTTDGTRQGIFGVDTVRVIAGAYSNHDYDLRTDNTTRVSIGSAGAVTISAPTSGVGLTVNGGVGTLPLNVNFGAAIAGFTQWMLASAVKGYIGLDGGGIIGAGSGNNFGIRADNELLLMGGGRDAMRIGTTGAVTINAPSSGVAQTINGVTSQVIAAFNGGSGGLAAIQLTDGQAGTRQWQIDIGRSAAGVFSIYDQTAGFDRLVITTDGRIYGTALHNNAGAVTGTTNQYIASGTYTPTLTNTTNVASSSFTNSPPAKWIRVGNVVQVSGHVTITPTAAAGTQTILDLSLPIASNFVNFEDCSGTASDGASGVGTANSSAVIQASIANDRAQIIYAANNTNSKIFSFNFSYTVL